MILGSIGILESVRNLYYIGQSALGGTIAYILQPGDPGYDANVQHGLVAGIAESSIAWDYDFCNLTGDTSTAFGQGSQNTTNIVINSSCTPVNPSASAPYRSYYTTQGGYSDWYLPSYDELAALFTTRVATGGWIIAPPSPPFGNLYWTSTADATNPSRESMFIDFEDIPRGSSSFRTLQWNYRPVRSF